MRALVIGAGRMGGFHRRVLRDLGLDVATVDPDPVTGADYLKVRSRNFDVVCIATPIDHLADEAAEWVGHEGWLLVEKPFAATLTDAEVMAGEFASQRVAVGYVERFNPQVRHVRDVIREDYGETPDSVRFSRWNERRSDNVALDLTSHDVDLARFLGLRCDVQYVAHAGEKWTARWVTVSTGEHQTAIDLMAHDASPLHAQWHAFLSGRAGYATPADAVHVLAALERMPTLAAA